MVNNHHLRFVTHFWSNIIEFCCFLLFFTVIRCNQCLSSTSGDIETIKGKYIREYILDIDDATFRIIDNIINVLYHSGYGADGILDKSTRNFNLYLNEHVSELSSLISKINQFNNPENSEESVIDIDIEKELKRKRTYYAGIQFEFSAFLISWLKNKHIWFYDRTDLDIHYRIAIPVFVSKMADFYREIHTVKSLIG